MFNIKDIPVSKFIVIGSYALQTRRCSDIDIVCYKKDILIEKSQWVLENKHTISFNFNNKKIECLLADEQESFKLLLDTCTFTDNYLIASFELLLAIKQAHIHRANIQWEKHIHDYTYLRHMFPYCSTRCIPEIPDYTIYDFYKIHKKTLDEVLGKPFKVPLKNVTVEDFFDDGVKKHFNHDWLHTVFAHKEQPIYTLLQVDPKIVYCDSKLWELLPYEEKLMCVLEECYVISVERFLIRKIKNNEVITNIESSDAFKKSLIKVCTTLTSGFFRDFAIHNYFVLLNNYNIKYYEILLNKLKIIA